jgi:acyl carrier protein
MGAESSAAPCGSARRWANLASFARSATAFERSRPSQRGIAAVDFSVIYGNIAALFAMSDADLRTRIKEMMVKNLMLQITADQISDDAPLFGPNGIGLDSIDALELAVGLEKNFGVSVPNSEIATKVLRNVNTIHDYILEKRGESAQSQASS